MVVMYRCQTCKVVKPLQEMWAPEFRRCKGCHTRVPGKFSLELKNKKRELIKAFGYRCSMCNERVTEQEGTAYIVPLPEWEEEDRNMTRAQMLALEDKEDRYRLLCRFHYVMWCDDLEEGKR